MNLQSLSLDPYFLARLFPQSIIPETFPSDLPDMPINLKYLGKNEKHILIIIQNEKEAFCNEASFTLLSNILRACQLQAAEDVAVFNCARYPSVSWKILNDFFNPVTVISFGVENSILFPQSLQKYQPEKFQDIQLISADSLSVLKDNKALKEKLWKTLQPFFLSK